MAKNKHIAVVGIMVATLLACCGHDSSQNSENNIPFSPKTSCMECDSVEDTLPNMQSGLVDVRKPDMKVCIRKGSALQLETSGLLLMATDTAVLHAGEYSVTSLLKEDLPPLPMGMKNLTAETAGYRLLPGGVHFSPYAELRVAYDPSKLPFGYTPEDVYTSYYDTSTLTWVRLERLYVDTINKEIVSVTNHFTDFINEILQSPEMPETEAFVPTQISGLEAANPLAGYATIAPPESNNMGTANITYPFQIPVGRGAVQPNMALTYNSNGGNGVCGLGWDMTIPCISVETRWGVPLYDNQKETETYLLNGEQLLVSHDSLPAFARRYELRDPNYTKRFYPRVEGSFDSILRHGTTPGTYWWDVYDRSGTRYIYGLGDGEQLAMKLGANGKNAIAKWYLTRVIDRNGNTARYYYKAYASGGDGSVSGAAMYLDKIVYTCPDEGFSNTPWYGYSVSFYYSNYRPDPVISGNYGVKENICRRLDSVKTWYVKNEPTAMVSIKDLTTSNDYMNIHTSLQNEYGGPVSESDTFYLSTLLRLVGWDSLSWTDSSQIRGYRLLYSTSGRGKSMLSAVVEMSPDEWAVHASTVTRSNLTPASIFKYHTFGYRDAAETTFSERKKLTSTSSSVPEILHNIVTSPLGGSKEKSIGGGINAGVGFDTRAWLRSINVDGSANWSRSWNDGLVTIVDLNGDGYPDRLWRKSLSPSLWNYQLFNPSTGVFVVTGTCSLPSDGFSSTVTKSRTFGAGVHVGIDTIISAGINVGYSHSHNDATTSVYFTDVNADGKADLIDDSKVYYNTSTSSQVSFSDNIAPYTVPLPPCEGGYYSLNDSEELDSTLSWDGHVSSTEVAMYTDIGKDFNFTTNNNNDTLSSSNADTISHSIVKVWIAPYDGSVDISGSAVLDRRFRVPRRRDHSDGVIVSIQRNNSVPDSFHLTIFNDSVVFNKTINDIVRGDRIYFRVEANRETSYDIVKWNPVVKYQNIPDGEFDADQRQRNRYESAQDFLSWQDEQFLMPVAGTVKVEADAEVNGINDTVKLGIYVTDTNGIIVRTDTSKIFAPAAHGTFPLTRYISLQEGEGLLFLAQSNHDVDWTKLSWAPHILSSSFVDTSIVYRSIIEHDSIDNDTIYSIDVWPSLRYSTFFMHTMPRSYTFNGTVMISTNATGVSQLAGRKAYLVERTTNNAIVMDSTVVSASDTNLFSVSASGSKCLEVYVKGRMPDYSANVNMKLADGTPVGLFFDTVCSIVGGGAETSVFGKMYRQWGQFVYNDIAIGRPIIESRIVEAYSQAEMQQLTQNAIAAPGLDTSSTSSPEDMIGTLESNLPCAETDDASSLTSLSIGGGDRVWSSTSGGAYLSPTHFALVNYQQAEWDLEELGENQSSQLRSTSGSGPKTVVKETRQNGHNIYVSANLGVGVSAYDTLGVSASYNCSFGDHELRNDYVDLNGDGYPDFMYENDVQYSNSRGGVSNIIKGSAPQGKSGIHKTHYLAYSLQKGESAPIYEKRGKGQGSVSVDKRSNGNNGQNLAYSTDNIKLTWMDINGDGLPDRIEGDSVNLNLGYLYYETEAFDNNPLPQNLSVNSASSLGFGSTIAKTINISFSAGLGHTLSTNQSTIQYADINGDGLIDKIVDNEKVYFNTGWEFTNSYYTLSTKAVNKSLGHNLDANGSLTLGFVIWSLKIQLTPNASLCYSSNSTEAFLMDMNADGLPDIVEHIGADIWVRYNQLYDVDKLVSVQSFYGNHIDIEYAQAPHSSSARQRPTVMSRLEVYDSTGKSNDRRLYKFCYSEYKHSVGERTPYGFANVADTQYLGNAPYRITSRNYRTDSYKMRGKKSSETIIDANGNHLVKNEWFYKLKQISNGAVVNDNLTHCYGATWPALDSSTVSYYNSYTRAPSIFTTERYIHADSGRVVEYINYNDNNDSRDDLHCFVKYIRKKNNQYALPEYVKIANSNNDTLRLRTASYNAKGMLVQLIQHGDNNQLSVSDYSYDKYGNAISFRSPQNANGQRSKHQFVYDSLMHMFRTMTIDSAFHDTSRAEYDVRIGLPVRVCSIGGDSISYTYDGWGRPQTIRAPQESDTSKYPTIRYLYWDDSISTAPQFVAPQFRSITGLKVFPGKVTKPSCSMYGGWPIWAQTLHRSAEDTMLNVTTVLFADGHGRVLQTKKTAVVDGTNVQVASGRVIYDDAGRAIQSYEPFVVNNGSYCSYSMPSQHGIVTLTTYDVLDRKLSTSIPAENITTTNEYDFSTISGITYFSDRATDPNGHVSTTLTDARGLTYKVTDAMGGTTRFEYDAMGQLTSSTDPDGFTTHYRYTKLGQLSERTHPDAGRTYYRYDPAGNIIYETNPLGDIWYKYTYHRLTDKMYSHLNENNVSYFYGDTGRNRGRVVKVRDGSGVQLLNYDEMGRVSNNVRVLSVPTSGYAYAFSHSFKYDSWNRMLNMTYPDGETIYYNYNNSGALVKMRGIKGDDPRRYIDSISYNKYGQRTYIHYGNGSHASYTYDNLQRLSLLRSEDSMNNAMQNIGYTFDRVGNIIRIGNTAAANHNLGGPYSCRYFYDSLNRLTSSEGGGTIGGQTCSYGLSNLTYSRSGRLATKTQNWTSITSSGAQSMVYTYPNSDRKPHAPTRIIDNNTSYTLRWDDAGNLLRISSNTPNIPQNIHQTPNDDRSLQWTEDNRLYAVSDDQYFSYYAYDHTGERTLKMTGDATSVNQNAFNNHIYSSLNNVTLYPSPYLVLTNSGYTKHYYAGADRVCARIGSGGLNQDTTGIRGTSEISQCVDSLFLHCIEQMNNYVPSADTGNIVTIDGEALLDTTSTNTNKTPTGLHVDVVPNITRFNAVFEESLSENHSPRAPYYEPDVYFYHSDHLGSASWITDGEGKAVQHLQYLPFGQPYINQHPAGYQERYFHGQGVRLRNRVWIPWREVHGLRADDLLAECRPAG